jgi:hypothetical protein
MKSAPALDCYESAIAASTAFRTSAPPDLIVIEQILPMLDLEEAITILRGISGYQNVPFAAFFSGYEPLDRRVNAWPRLQKLYKPVDEKQLLDLFSIVFGLADQSIHIGMR